MKRLVLAGLVAAAILGTAGGASAQYYDRGYYPPPPPPPYYGERYYGEPRHRGYAQPRSFRPAYVDRHGIQTYYPGRRGTCPPRYTVQDGVCKPYRGF